VPRERGLSGAFLGRRHSFDRRPWSAGFLAHCLAYSALGDERTAQWATDLSAHVGDIMLSALSNQAEKHILRISLTDNSRDISALAVKKDS
jgi:hypothetical protein